MSALAIVAMSVVGGFVYLASAVYVYFRLRWYQTQRDHYADEMAAFFPAVVLPLGVVLLAVYTHGLMQNGGIPPRPVRRERKIKEQEEEIARLERELNLR